MWQILTKAAEFIFKSSLSNFFGDRAAKSAKKASTKYISGHYIIRISKTQYHMGIALIVLGLFISLPMLFLDEWEDILIFASISGAVIFVGAFLIYSYFQYLVKIDSGAIKIRNLLGKNNELNFYEMTNYKYYKVQGGIEVIKLYIGHKRVLTVQNINECWDYFVSDIKKYGVPLNSEDRVHLEHFTVCEPKQNIRISLLMAIAFLAFFILMLIFPDGKPDLLPYLIFAVLFIMSAASAYGTSRFKIAVNGERIAYTPSCGKTKAYRFSDFNRYAIAERNNLKQLQLYIKNKKVMVVRSNCIGYSQFYKKVKNAEERLKNIC